MRKTFNPYHTTNYYRPARHLVIAAVFTFLTFNPFLELTCTHAWSQEKEVVFFKDDFEDGNANGWQLDSNWQVVQENGNYILKGADHSWATIGDKPWGNYSFKFRVKLSSGAVHLNYRVKDCLRYFVSFHPEGLDLLKTQPCGNHPLLQSVSSVYNLDQWYTFEIVGNGRNIKVYVDDILKIDYTDPDPVLFGAIAFENLPNSQAYFDDIVVKGNVSTKVTWQKTTGLPGGGVTGMAFAPSNPDIVYAATNVNQMGIFRSSDGGKSWQRTFRAGHTTGLAVDPNNPDIAYIVDIHGQIHKTVNGGVTWERKIEVHSNLNTIVVSLSNPAILYAGASNGSVFKSSDGGESWTQTSSGLPAVSSLVVHAVNSDLIYAGTENSIYKSTNGGNSWMLSGVSGISVTELTIDPNNSDVLFAATSNGLYQTTNGGNSWQRKSNGLTTRDVHHVAVDPTNSSIVYAATLIGIFKSVDGGEKWSATNSGLDFHDVSFLAIHPTQPKQILAGTGHWLWTFHYHFPNKIYYHEGIYRSDNSGATWNRSDSGFEDDDVRTLTVDPKDANILYVGTECSRGVYKTSDGGITWGLTPEGDPNNIGDLAHYSMTIAVGQAAPYPVYLTGRFGVGKSLNGGQSWQNLFHRRHFHGVAIEPTNSQVVYIGTAAETDATENTVYPGAHIFKTSNGGISWDEMDNGFPHGTMTAVHAIAIDPSHPDTVYVTTAQHGHHAATSTLGIFKTTDGGLNWSAANNGLTSLEVPVLVIDPNNTDILYAGTDDGVFKTIDGGATWSQTGLSNRSIHALVIDPTDTKRVYAGGADGVSMSADGGISWTPVNYGLDGEVNSLAIASSGKVLYAGVPYNGVYRGILTAYSQTSLYCDFWSNNSLFQNQSLPTGAVITAMDPDGIVCGVMTVENTGSYNLRVYGDDPGTATIDEGAKEGDVINFNINGFPATPTAGNTIWTSGGAIQLDLSTLVTSVEAIQSGIRPDDFRLCQNYPNPFNPSTTIQFTIPRRAQVSLKIFDVLGREVTTLIDEMMQPGQHQVIFQTKNLSTGVYFYQIQMGQFQAVKKMVLLQ